MSEKEALRRAVKATDEWFAARGTVQFKAEKDRLREKADLASAEWRALALPEG